MAFGVDFGTTNSVVTHLHQGKVDVLLIDRDQIPATWDRLGFEQVMPTVFGVGDSDETIFGWEAKLRSGSIAAVKRLLKEEEYVEVAGERYPVEEIVTMLFAHLRRQVEGQGLTMDRAVVTIPANSRGLARYRTKITAGMAGLRVPALINEPTAAAMAYARQSTHDETLLVVDWGGGTLDVTILRHVGGVFMEQASKGIQKLGGLDFDAALAKVIKATVKGVDSWTSAQRHGFRLDVELAKILLSTREETSVELPGGDYRKVTRDMLLKAVRPHIERVRDPIERCLADVGAQPSDIDTVLLVGGTCKIPAVRDFVSEILKTAPASGVDPMTAIAEGASVASAILSDELEDNDFFVSTEHALGTSVLAPDRSGLVFSELIPRNHKLPATATDMFTAVSDYQEKVNIDVVEGDPELPLDDPENVPLKDWTVDLPNPVPAAESIIKMTYHYDTDGILHVSAEDQAGEEILGDVVSFGGMLDRRGLVEASNRAKKAMESGRVEQSGRAKSSLSPEARELVNNVKTKVIPFVDDKEAEEMRSKVAQVEDGDAGAVDDLRRLVDQYSYLL